jgi:hypothetical protein
MPVKIGRITISGGVPFENVEIYLPKEQAGLGVPIFFEDAQILIKARDGKFIIPHYQIIMIELRKNPKTLQPDVADKVKRLSISGDLSYSPAYIIKPSKYADLRIPNIFGEYEQMTFACGDGILITSDMYVTCMQYE